MAWPKTDREWARNALEGHFGCNVTACPKRECRNSGDCALQALARAHVDIAQRHEPKMRVFTTGANRDLDDSKLDFDGFLSPLVIERFAQYMHKNRHTANGLRDSDNWQKGIPVDVYRKSGWRHWFECWQLGRSGATSDALEEALCALLFNVQGWLHEIIKARSTGAR